MLDLHNDIRGCVRRKFRFVCGKPPRELVTSRVFWVRDVNGEIWGAVDPLHQLAHRDSFDDHWKRRRNASFDYAIYLIVEMDEVILGWNYEEIRFDQCNVEMPCEITPQCCFPNSIAAIYRDDYSREPTHDWCQGIYDFHVTWENRGQGDA